MDRDTGHARLPCCAGIRRLNRQRDAIPILVKLSEAPSYGQPIIIYDPRSHGAVAYRDVAEEVHYGPA